MKTLRKYLIPTILSVVFVYLLYINLGDVDLRATLLDLDPKFLAVAFLFYLVVAVLRAARISTVYSEQDYPFKMIFSISSVHTLVSNILPSRLGEFSFIYLMKQVFSQHFSKNTVALIFIRIIDTFIVSSFFLISSIVVSFKYVQVDNILFLVVIAFLLGVVSFYLDSLVVIFSGIFRSIVEFFRLDNFEKIKKLMEFVDTLSGFKILKDKGIYWKNVLLTTLVWVGLIVANYFMIAAMGFELVLPLVFFSSTGAVLTSLIPVTSLAAIGTYELGWIGTFALVGLSKEQAILTGLTVHALNFIFSLFLGLIGLWVIRLRK